MCAREQPRLEVGQEKHGGDEHTDRLGESGVHGVCCVPEAGRRVAPNDALGTGRLKLGRLFGAAEERQIFSWAPVTTGGRYEL